MGKIFQASVDHDLHLRVDEGCVSHLRGDEGGGDAEVEGEEEREDCEQGVQVQHSHHLVLPQTCLPGDKRKHQS